MPFFLILPLWLVLLVLSVPLFFVRRLRFLGTHIAIASTAAVLVSFVLSTLILFGSARLLPDSRFSGVAVISLYLLSIIGGGVAGSAFGMVLAHKLNRRLSWWPIPPERT